MASVSASTVLPVRRAAAMVVTNASERAASSWCSRSSRPRTPAGEGGEVGAEVHQRSPSLPRSNVAATQPLARLSLSPFRDPPGGQEGEEHGGAGQRSPARRKPAAQKPNASPRSREEALVGSGRLFVAATRTRKRRGGDGGTTSLASGPAMSSRGPGDRGGRDGSH